jgi:hypothetical protein
MYLAGSKTTYMKLYFETGGNAYRILVLGCKRKELLGR